MALGRNGQMTHNIGILMSRLSTEYVFPSSHTAAGWKVGEPGCTAGTVGRRVASCDAASQKLYVQVEGHEMSIVNARGNADGGGWIDRLMDGWRGILLASFIAMVPCDKLGICIEN